MTDFSDFEALRGAVGTVIGVSDWITVDQDTIDQFAAATGDHQWIHTDPDRASQGPYGKTIAHGFLTLALLAPISQQVMSVSCARMAINYGLDKVRFLAPVPAGSRLRGTVELTSVSFIQDGVQATRTVTIMIENVAKPACVAEHLVRYLR
ncbi:MaoC family dehydratase [Nocardia goodfellowii]